jgi:hypothetical protein
MTNDKEERGPSFFAFTFFVAALIISSIVTVQS